MEALQRSVLSNNWITLIFVFSILLLFFLKLFTTAKLKGYVTSLFNKGFVEIEAEENYWTLSFFHTGFSLFTFLRGLLFERLFILDISSDTFSSIFNSILGLIVSIDVLLFV